MSDTLSAVFDISLFCFCVNLEFNNTYLLAKKSKTGRRRAKFNFYEVFVC